MSTYLLMYVPYKTRREPYRNITTYLKVPKVIGKWDKWSLDSGLLIRFGIRGSIKDNYLVPTYLSAHISENPTIH